MKLSVKFSTEIKKYFARDWIYFSEFMISDLLITF